MVFPADDDSIAQREMTWHALIAACIALWFLGALYLGVGGLLIGIGCMTVIIGACTVTTTRAPLQGLFPALNRRHARPHLGRGLAVRNMMLGTMFIFLGSAGSVSDRHVQLALDLGALLIGIPGLGSYLLPLRRAGWRRPAPPAS